MYITFPLCEEESADKSYWSHTHISFGFIHSCRCLQIAPGDRANPRELLCSPWLAQAYRPTFHDLTLLRTTVLRILNVADAHQLEGIPEGKGKYSSFYGSFVGIGMVLRL